MSLHLDGEGDSLFSHNRDFSEGVKERGIRPGQATVVVALDGSGDAESIQEGIDMLPAGGGVVYIKEGTYTLSVKLDITTANVSLIGAGRSTKITATSDIILLDINADYFNISNLYFKGDSSSTNDNLHITAGTNGYIFNCWSEIAGHSGFGGTSSASDFVIHSCTAKDSKGYGIHFWGDNTIISNCICHSNDLDGIALTNSERSIIIGCLSTQNIRSGIRIYNSERCIISNNHCYDNDYNNTTSYDGIRITTSSHYHVITGNLCQNNDRYEISIGGGCDRNIVCGNMMYAADHVAAFNDAGTNTVNSANIVA